jgi:hypothetical protein
VIADSSQQQKQAIADAARKLWEEMERRERERKEREQEERERKEREREEEKEKERREQEEREKAKAKKGKEVDDAEEREETEGAAYPDVHVYDMPVPELEQCLEVRMSVCVDC